MARYNQTERSGVGVVQQIVVDQLRWVFREQLVADVGIDAHIETVSDGNPTGKLIAVQVKSGESHFSENDRTYTHYIDATHYEYWTNHSLPLLLVGVISPKNVIWQKLTRSNIEKTKKGYKTLIPKGQLFGAEAEKQLRDFADGPLEVQRIRKLLMDKPLVECVAGGESVSVEFDDWPNKSLGRSTIVVRVGEEQRYVWEYVFTGLSAPELVGQLFPWATCSIDERYYETHCQYDDEELLTVRQQHGSLYPYSDDLGEVEHYRVALRLNSFGRHLPSLFEYLDSGRGVV